MNANAPPEFVCTPSAGFEAGSDVPRSEGTRCGYLDSARIERERASLVTEQRDEAVARGETDEASRLTLEVARIAAFAADKQARADEVPAEYGDDELYVSQLSGEDRARIMTAEYRRQIEAAP